MNIGRRYCTEPPTDTYADPTEDGAGPVDVPWSTGFEDGFCGYEKPHGFCLATGTSSLSLVTTPVHSGHHAAAFSVLGTSDAGGAQSRCVVQGVFPSSAYYGAWYYVPTLSKNNNGRLWNLIHFQSGAAVGSDVSGRWDVSLKSLDDGNLQLFLYPFQNVTLTVPTTVPPIPIGKWFHVEVYFKRANDLTGTISLYQDGSLVATLANANTDPADWGQWYVGNLATDLTPPFSTIYVDDITIRSEQ